MLDDPLPPSDETTPQGGDFEAPGEQLVVLRRLVRESLEAVLTLDETGCVTALNGAAERLFGRRAHEVLGRPIDVLVVATGEDLLDRELQRCLSGGSHGLSMPSRAAVRRADGGSIPVEFSFCDVSNGGRRQFFAIARDVAARCAAEQHQRLADALLEHSSDSALTVDMEGNIAHWNAGAERLYGYPPEQALGMPMRLLQPSDRVAQWRDHVDQLLQGSKVLPYETQRVSANGELVDVLCTMTMLQGFGGLETYIAITDRDITAQKLGEQALRRSEAKTRAIVEVAIDAIITIWSDGRIESVNRAAEQLFGYMAEEMVGRNVNMLMPNPYREQHDGYLLRYVRTGVPRIIGRGREVTGVRKDGSTFPADLAITELRVGDLHLFTGIVRDISEQKRTEQELKAQAESIAEANRVLREAMLRAEQATAAKSAFLANMSHEIRTPMTAILGFAESLVEALRGSTHSDALTTIQRNGEHLLTIINDILDLSRVEDGRMTVESVDCSALQIAAEVRGLMRGRAAEKGLELAVSCVSEIPMVMQTDPTRLRQIFVNLVGNAVKFTERGSVQMRFGFEPESARDPARLVIDVIDTGIGMTDEQVQRVFEPFAQADVTSTRRFGGTGLGLAITQRMAVLLGGVVTVKSSIGRGSTFRVVLPVAVAEEATFTREVPEVAAACLATEKFRMENSLTGMHVLLAEDGLDNQRLIVAMLRQAGAQVTVVGDGLRAVEAATGAVAPFDVILMDMQMPVLDGYAATSELRRRGYQGSIVALTAHAMNGDRERCLVAGCDGYSSKPIRRRELVRTMHEAVSARR